MADRSERFHGAMIRHGREGMRIYVMELPGFMESRGDAPGETRSQGRHSSGRNHLEEDEYLCEALEKLALDEGYTKIFAKVPSGRVVSFLRRGYRVEALVPRMYHGREDVFFLAWYPQSPEAAVRQIADPDSMAILDRLIRSKCPVHEPPLPGKYRWFHCTEDDLEEMGALYKKVFDRYPFPIHKPDYLEATMQDHVEYFGIRRRDTNSLVALSSAELHRGFNSVEMTDFAVLPGTRGDGLALFLLRRMDEHVTEQGIPTAYTIARLRSPGMNATFIKGGYRYAGTLPGNTFIGGGLESMNVFYRTGTSDN